MRPINHQVSMVLKLSLIALALNLAACAGTRKAVNEGDPEDFVWPLPPDPPRIQFVKSVHSEMEIGRKRSLAQRIFEGIFGRAPLRALKKPLAVHTDQSGRVLVVDTGWRKVLIFDFQNKSLQILGNKGKGRLLNPLGVTTDDLGRIYVTDAGGQRVMIYDANGKYLTAFGGQGVLVRPSGIAVNSKLGDGLPPIVYVVDTWAHQIKAFNSRTGNLLLTIGKSGKKPQNGNGLIEGTLDQAWNRGDGEGEFRFPTQIAIGPDGRLYVVDTLNFRVQIFTPNGKFVKTFGQVGNLPGNLYRPKGIGLDSEGHIYVSDAAFSNVQIFDRDGKLLLHFGSFGSGLADLRLPAGMYIDEQDQVYVVDQFNNRIQIYQYLSGTPTKEKELITTKKGGEKP
ncbi:MAG: 6-bladed beta-propeller [bacterium]